MISGFFPDPSVCRVGKDYWLAASSFEYWPSIPLFHSHDLIHWTPVGHALDRRSQLDLTGRESSKGLFAPTLRYHQGRFYLICTDVGGNGNFILTTTEVPGAWSDPIWIQEGEGFTWFDPSLLFDDDGRVYYTRREAMEIWQAELDPETGRLTSEFRHLASPMASDDIEGPHLYKIDGRYYLLAAEGGTGWGHRITCARADSPWGPFEPCPHNPILTHSHLCHTVIRSTGHGDLLEAHDGSWWLFLLGTRHGNFGGQPFHHLGRETFLAPVAWEDGWPVVNGGQPIGEQLAAPDFADPRQAVAKTTHDDFSGSALSPHWIYRRTQEEQAFCLADRPGHLRLRGTAHCLRNTEPEAFVGQRLDEPFFRLSAELDFAAENERDQAGLALVMADDCFATWLLDERGGQTRVRLHQRTLSLETEVAAFAIAPGPCKLEITGDWKAFQFSLIDSNGQRVTAPLVDRRLLSTELATGWTGLIAGLYATGNGQRAESTADFSNFVHHRSPFPLAN